MLVSKMIKKLEKEKGFRCNRICDTCICGKTRMALTGQYEVYDELKDVMGAERYAKEVYRLRKEADALDKCCERLEEAFFTMIDEKTFEYCCDNDDRLNINKMPSETYIVVYNNVKESFIDEYTGGDRYTRK